MAQRIRCGVLDRWFSHFPLMGNEEHYAILMPLLAWYRWNQLRGSIPCGTRVACFANGVVNRFARDDCATVRHVLFVTFVSCFINNSAKVPILSQPRARFAHTPGHRFEIRRIC